MDNSTYSICLAHELGDKYLASSNWLAAELCYALPTIGHPFNIVRESDTCPITKYNQFIKYKTERNPQLKEKVEIPCDALQLLESFYTPWIQQIKPELIERCEVHTKKRAQAIVEVFYEATNNNPNIGVLDISQMERKALESHKNKIESWNGPSFKHLQYRNNKRIRETKQKELTCIYDQNGYKKRCMNSQEDWFKKYDGEFFGNVLSEINRIFTMKLGSNTLNFRFVCIKFIKNLLSASIQFPLAKAGPLLPHGTLFADNNELQNILKKFNNKLDIKDIKNKNNAAKRVKNLHNKLLIICKAQYDEIQSQIGNDMQHFDGYNDGEDIGLNTVISAIPDFGEDNENIFNFDVDAVNNNNIGDHDDDEVVNNNNNNLISTVAEIGGDFINNEQWGNIENIQNMQNIQSIQHIQNGSNYSYHLPQQQTYDMNVNRDYQQQQNNDNLLQQQPLTMAYNQINQINPNQMNQNVAYNQFQHNIYNIPQQQQHQQHFTFNQINQINSNQTDNNNNVTYNQYHPPIYNIQQQAQQHFVCTNNMNHHNHNNYNNMQPYDMNMNNGNIPVQGSIISDTPSTHSFISNQLETENQSQCDHFYGNICTEHQIYNNNHRQFQTSNNFTNPSRQIHRNLNIPNDRYQRRLVHIQQMRSNRF